MRRDPNSRHDHHHYHAHASYRHSSYKILCLFVCSPACLPASLHCTAPLSQLPNDYRPTERLRPRPPPMELSSACLPHCVPQSSSTYTILSPSSSTADRLTHSQSFSLRAPHNIRHHRTQPHKPHHDEVVSTCDRPTARPPAAAGPPPIPLLLRNTACAVRARYRNAGWLAGGGAGTMLNYYYTLCSRSVGPKFPYFDIPAAAAAVVRY